MSAGAPSTITRTAARDPEFAAQLARAEGNAETEALSLIRKAAHKERYWRAAAWLLERKNPADFAARKPDVMTPEQLRRMLASLATLILQDLSEEKFEEILMRLDQVRLGEADCPPGVWPGATGVPPVLPCGVDADELALGPPPERSPPGAGRVPLASRQCFLVALTRMNSPSDRRRSGTQALATRQWHPANRQCSPVALTRMNSLSDRRRNGTQALATRQWHPTPLTEKRFVLS